jgi:predicted Zn-dependent protease
MIFFRLFTPVFPLFKQGVTRWYISMCMAICLSIITSFGCGGALQNFNIVSDSQEIEMGRQFSQELERELKFYEDPEVVEYIQDLGQNLAKVSKRTNITYHIKVVDTDVVNAFALPGGYLYVNRGLISTAESESELAGVMGHEIGHVVGRHGAKALSRQNGLQFITGLVLGQSPGAARQIASQFAGIGGALGMFHYSREAEREADALAVEELYEAGIDPDGVAKFFEKLMALHENESSGLEALFSTHPPSGERVENARADIALLPQKPDLRKDSARFQRIKKRLPSLKKPEGKK